MEKELSLHGRSENLISQDLTKMNFGDKYKCENLLGVYKYGRSNSAILKDTIKGIDNFSSLSEEEQQTVLLEKFGYLKRVFKCTDDKLLEIIHGEETPVASYEYLSKIHKWAKSTIGLLVRYDIIKKINKPDWTIEDVIHIFQTEEKFVRDRIMFYTNDYDADSDKNKKIFNKMYEPIKYDETGKVVKSEAAVNFINEFFQSEKQDYDCEVFFNDKPIVIYKSEIEALKVARKKYCTNEKDGRGKLRLLCLLLAWQKAYQNKYYYHRFRPYAEMKTDDLKDYNPVVDVKGRSDSVRMIADREVLTKDGYILKMLPTTYAPREAEPKSYYSVSFFVDSETTDNEEVALVITDFENIWEQIYVTAFKEFDVLEEPKEKDIKQGEIKEYDKKLKAGKVYISDKNKEYSFSGKYDFKAGDAVNVYIQDSKKGKVKVLKKANERVYVTYKAVKRCSICGKMFYAKQMGNGTGNCDVCNRR